MKLRGIHVVAPVIVTNFAAIAVEAVVIGRSENLTESGKHTNAKYLCYVIDIDSIKNNIDFGQHYRVFLFNPHSYLSR